MHTGVARGQLVNAVVRLQTVPSIKMRPSSECSMLLVFGASFVDVLQLPFHSSSSLCRSRLGASRAKQKTYTPIVDRVMELEPLCKYIVSFPAGCCHAFDIPAGHCIAKPPRDDVKLLAILRRDLRSSVFPVCTGMAERRRHRSWRVRAFLPMSICTRRSICSVSLKLCSTRVFETQLRRRVNVSQS